MNHKIIFPLLLSFLIFSSCGQKTSSSTNNNDAKAMTQHIFVPSFNADSAYLYIQKQVDFGPRVPNTEAHRLCAEYLSNELRRFGAEVIEQRADLTAYDGTILKSVNIIGSFNPESSERILLMSHWDSRPFADNDKNTENHKEPVLGANDGASGVGVLLEIARQINNSKPFVGIDIIFFDAEDYGQPYFSTDEEMLHSWCLGSQYWSQNPHKPNYAARYGILLDMVGHKNATFAKDRISMAYASEIVDNVWKKAAAMGYADLFVDRTGGYITDDHVYVNEYAGVKSIDIIDFNNGFFDHWHTVNDSPEHIDKGTLKAVGQVLLEVIYEEK